MSLPPAPQGLYSAAYWRERAEEARAKAATMRDAEAVRTMLSVAELYERMAQRAEARNAPRSGPDGRLGPP